MEDCSWTELCIVERAYGTIRIGSSKPTFSPSLSKAARRCHRPLIFSPAERIKFFHDLWLLASLSPIANINTAKIESRARGRAQALVNEGHVGKGRPNPPRGEERKNQLDLFFDWARAKALRLAQRLDDFSFISVGFSSLIVPVLVAGWLTVPGDSDVRPILAKASVAAFVLAALAWTTRGLHSSFGSYRWPIAIHSLAFGGSLIVGGWALISLMQSDAARDAMRAEQAALSAQERVQEAEADRKIKAEQELAATTARDAAVKEAECLAKFAAAVRATQKRLVSGKSRLETCQTEYGKKLLKYYTLEDTCRAEYAEVDTANKAHAAALRKVCSTASTKR